MIAGVIVSRAATESLPMCAWWLRVMDLISSGTVVIIVPTAVWILAMSARAAPFCPLMPGACAIVGHYVAAAFGIH